MKWNSNLDFNDINFSQHLGISKYFHRTLEEWKNLNYKENPIDVEKTSGIIFDNNKYVCTFGNNEFCFDNKNIIITLFRSTGFLGKSNLRNRPGVTSGIVGHHISTPLAQLTNRNMVFEFKLGKNEDDVNDIFNSFFKKVILFHPNSKNLIKSRMEKFVTLKNGLKNKKININFDKGFVSSSRFINNALCLNVVNFNNKSADFNKIKVFKLKFK